MKQSESGEKKANRQCWECLKRRLVCDRTLSQCKKCIKASKDCPGYDEQKPLQWVEPGKVTSRRRKKEGAPKVYTIRARDKESVASTVPVLPTATSQKSDSPDLSESVPRDESSSFEWPIMLERRLSPEAFELYNNQLSSLLVQEDNAAWWHSLTTEERKEHTTMMALETSANLALADCLMQIGSKGKLKKILEDKEWKLEMLFPSDRDPLAKLQRLLWIMEMNQLPSYDHLSNESCEVVQAVTYCKFASQCRTPVIFTLQSIPESCQMSENPKFWHQIQLSYTFPCGLCMSCRLPCTIHLSV